MLKDCKAETQHSNLPGKPAAGVFLQDKYQLHELKQRAITNLNRETQKIQQRLAKPLVARLKYKWSLKKKKTIILS
jgi:hypothetical protein